MFTDVSNAAGDYFMAGSADWQSRTCLNSLVLQRTITLEADAKPERLDRAMLAEVGNRCGLVAAIARAAVMQ